MQKTFIIAEAGVNHNGNLYLAKKLISAAKAAGADAVKFQAFKAENLASQSAKKADYQIAATGSKESQQSMLRALELTPEAHVVLKRYSRTIGIEFLSSPFDVKSAEMLVKLGMRIIKIPSGEITNLPLLRAVGATRRKVILSTGMATLSEVGRALKWLYSSGTPKHDVTLLHCNTEYPTPIEDVNLNAMATMRKRFNVNVGYSDHTLGIAVPIAAVAMGAVVLEKHLTLDRNMSGPDHRASLEPSEFSEMVSSVRAIESAFGNGVKTPSRSEMKNIVIARKSIVAARDILKGEIFSERNLTVKRPANGISPVYWDKVLGRRATKNFKKDTKISMRFL